ncbi:MAG: ribonuclease J [Nitrospirae bacterium RBG_19FT_COMBO_42_15]|nr:MAG: ribonuclease J [Nitrospirae bacterium RBG_19FT_COMBO_42_15]
MNLSIIPLGGLGEIGLNMMLFEYGDDIIVVDAGLMFPEEEMLGVDIVIPDITYLKERKDKIRGIIITHGHEDHIGALPYILREINVPIYATPLTIGLIKGKLKEHKLDETSELISVKPRQIIELGCFIVEFIRVTHSIVDGVGLGITTPVGRIVHTGDFKLDQTPVDGELLDFHKFSEYGDKGTLALLSDSTNSEREGYTLSEKEVGKAIERVFGTAKKRIILATFASNIHRIQQVIDAAVKFDRKVILNGRSIINNAQVALDLGYLKMPEKTWIKLDEMKNYSPDKIAIITTGSQGEPMSSLARMAVNEHKDVQIEEGDTVVLSSRVIPGNEKAISRIINHLFRRGANVIYEDVSDIHVSGHASQEEQKLMMCLVRPKFFVPIHGEYRHLIYHARLAETLGISKDNIFILEDGDVLELNGDAAVKKEKVQAGRVFVDGKVIGDVGNIVLRDRMRLGTDGIIVVFVGIEKMTGKVVTGPDIVTRGFVFEEESQELIEEMKRVVSDLLGQLEQELMADWVLVKTKVRNTLKKYLIKKMDRKPMIIPIIIEL